MAVAIAVMATQNLGKIETPDGEAIPTWKVEFRLDAEDLITTEIAIRVNGATKNRDAQQKALKILQQFLSEGYATAKNYQV